MAKSRLEMYFGRSTSSSRSRLRVTRSTSSGEGPMKIIADYSMRVISGAGARLGWQISLGGRA